jgi:hypothetical protein
MAPVTFMVEGDQNVNFVFTKYSDSGILKPGAKLNIQDLLYNRPYQFQVTVEGSAEKFDCSFTPRSQNWTNPFIVTIIPSKKSCISQLPY